MNYLFKCPDCGAYKWVSGSLPCPETNAVEYNEKDEVKPWLIKDANNVIDEYQGHCQHDNADVVDSEYEEPLIDDII